MAGIDTKLPPHQEWEKNINKKEIKTSADIFSWDPERDAEKLRKVIDYLKTAYNLSWDTLWEVEDTIKKVDRLTELKWQIPREETLKAANNSNYKQNIKEIA